MVAALPKTRSDSAADRIALVKAATALTDVQEQLIETIETETAVKIFAARNMPQASEAQRADRQAAIQIAASCGCRRSARSDATGPTRTEARGDGSRTRRSRRISRRQLGIALLHAAFSGARANLEGKLSSLTDAPYSTSVADELARLSEDTTTAMRAAESFLQVPPS
jgi:formiminotetrahydrofolate cyclodeaminase